MIADTVVAGLARVSAQAGVLVVLVILVQWLFRRKLTARWRCALWTLVFVRLLVPYSPDSPLSIFNLLPAWPAAGASSIASTPPAFTAPRIAANDEETARTPLASPALAPSDPRKREPLATEKPAPATAPDVLPGQTTSGDRSANFQTASRWEWSGVPIGMIAFLVWIGGMLLLSATLALRSIRLARRYRVRRALDSPEIEALLQDCLRRTGLTRGPALMECPAIASPALFGLFRPQLILPAGFLSRFSLQELQFVLLHELAHLRRRDLWGNWLATLLTIFHWFNPLIWLGFARWRADRELACDAIALEAAGHNLNRDYGRTILHLMAADIPSPTSPVLAGIFESRRRLRDRIDQIARFRPGQRSRGWAAVAFGLLMALGLTDAQNSQPATQAAVLPAGRKTPDLLVRFHFAGRKALGADGSASILKQVDNLPETAALRAHFGRRLGEVATTVWGEFLPAGIKNQPELLQPLIEDLTSCETLIEVRGPIGRSETVIAVELTDERAQQWQTNLLQLSRAWQLGTPATTALEGVSGWKVVRPEGPGLQVFRRQQWTLLGLGPDRSPALESALRSLVHAGRPMAAGRGMLDLQADLPKLGKWFPVLTRFPLAPVHLTVVGRDENVRTELQIQYQEKIPWKFEAWQIPTNLVSEPLTSFTIAQGVQSFLAGFEGLRSLGITLPNQFCAWGAFHQYGHTFFSVPQSQASNMLAGIYPKADEVLRHYFDTPLGQLLYAPSRGEIAWGGGLPGIAPTLASTKTAGGEFLYARMFPLLPSRTQPPADLFAQFQGRTNLLYYDWELTSNRIDVARQLYSLGNIFDRRPPPPSESPSQKWLRAVGPLLANTATEITQTSPHELRLVRKSQIGFTGIELATFSAWLESPGFPHRIERQPAIRLDRIKRQPSTPSVSVPARSP